MKKIATAIGYNNLITRIVLIDGKNHYRRRVLSCFDALLRKIENPVEKWYHGPARFRDSLASFVKVGVKNLKKLAYLLMLCLILLPLTACGSDKNSPSNQTILYNLDREPKTLDPQICGDIPSQIVIANIFEGLTRIDENNAVVPGVATHWKSNPEHTVYTFSLREDACWANEEKTNVTADDFVYGLRRAVSANTKAPLAYTLFCIENAEKISSGTLPETSLGVFAEDAHTLTIKLEYAYEDFPRLLSTPVAMPCNERFFESTSGKYGLESSAVLCNGPFKIRKKYGWDHDEAIHLLANPDYHSQETPVPAGVEFSIGKDVTNLVKAIEGGVVDAGALAGEQLQEAVNLGYNLTSFEDTTWGLCFNFSDELFKNANVRKGFIQALNRDFILGDIPENCTVANDIIMDSAMLDGKSYRDLAGRNFYVPESPEARQTLNAGLKQLGLNELPNVTVLCSENPSAKAMVSNILQLWNEKFGCYLNMAPTSMGKISDKVQIGDFQIALLPITAETDDPFEVLSSFRSNAKNNICDMKISEYDQLLDAATKASVEDKVMLYASAEKYLNEQGAFYPLYNEKRYFASSPKVSGILFYPDSGAVSFLKATKAGK